MPSNDQRLTLTGDALDNAVDLLGNAHPDTYNSIINRAGAASSTPVMAGLVPRSASRLMGSVPALPTAPAGPEQVGIPLRGRMLGAVPSAPSPDIPSRPMTDPSMNIQPVAQGVTPSRGVLGKVGNVLGTVGKIAASALIPGVAPWIPGTDQHNIMEERLREQQAQAGAETDKTRAEGAEAGARAGMTTAQTEMERQKIAEEPTTAANIEVDRLAQAQQRKDLGEAAGVRATAAHEKVLQALAQHGQTMDESGNITNIPDDQLPAEVKSRLDSQRNLDKFRTAQSDLAGAKADLARAGNDPNSPAYKLQLEKVRAAEANAQRAQESLNLRESFAVPQEGGGQVLTPVKPGQEIPTGAHKIGTGAPGELPKPVQQPYSDYEAASENYRFMSDLYNDIQKAGKMTGPESMALLARHMGINFPPGAGMRQSIQMIQAHADARSYPQAFQAWLQKFDPEAGGIITPEQAKSFVKMADDQRKERYQTLQREAKVYGADLGNVQGPEQGTGGGPTVGAVENGYKFRGGNPSDKANWVKQ